MGNCVLCNTNAVINRQDSASRTIYNCPNCGVFVVSDLEEKGLMARVDDVIPFLMARNLRRENDIVLISYEKANLDKEYLQLTVAQISEYFPKSFARQMDMALQNLALMSEYPGCEVRVDDLKMAPLFYVRKKKVEALHYVIKSMQYTGVIDVNYFGGGIFPCGVTISPKGWERLDELSKGKSGGEVLYFCATKKDDELTRQYSSALGRIAKEFGFNLLYSYERRVEQKVTNELVAGVKSAGIVVCDFSEPLGEIYYAAALAQGLGKRCILTCHESAKKKLQIDTKQFSVIYWDNQDALYLELLSAIKARF